MRETIITLRRLLAGETIDFGGSRSHLAFATGQPVPLLLAGRGPRILELAGEVADGVFPYVGLHRANIDYVLEQVARGAASDGRDPRALEYVWDIHMALAPTRQEALAAARSTCAYWLAQPSQLPYFAVRAWMRQTHFMPPVGERPSGWLPLYRTKRWLASVRL